MKMKIVVIVAIILVVLILAGAFSLWYIGKTSILDKTGMVYEEPSAPESESDF